VVTSPGGQAREMAAVAEEVILYTPSAAAASAA
jgi:hypothetical protein